MLSWSACPVLVGESRRALNREQQEQAELARGALTQILQQLHSCPGSETTAQICSSTTGGKYLSTTASSAEPSIEEWKQFSAPQNKKSQMNEPPPPTKTLLQLGGVNPALEMAELV